MAGKGFCGLGAAALAMATGACTGGSAPSNAGFLTTYEGLAPRTDVVRASVAQRRDEALASSITRLWVAPAEIFGVNSLCFRMTTSERCCTRSIDSFATS